MGERWGHPEAGWVIGLVALVGTLVLAVLSWVMFTDPFAEIANGCIETGGSCLQSRLGHAPVKTTLDTYGHLYKGLDEAAASALDDMMARQAVGFSRG